MLNNKTATYSLLFIAFVISIDVLRDFQSFLRPFVVAIILTLLFMPAVRHCQKCKIPFPLIIAGITLFFIAIIALCGLVLSDQGAKVYQSLPNQEQHLDTAIAKINAHLTSLSIGDKQLELSDIVDPKKLTGMLTLSVQSFVRAIQAISTELFLILLFLMFLLPSYQVCLKNVDRYFTVREAKQIKNALLHIENSIKEYLITKILVSIGTAFVSWIFLFAFDVPYAFVLAFFVFALNFIPNVGSLIAVGFALIIAFFSLSFTQLVWLAILLGATQTLFGNIIEPKLTGEKLNLSPIVILLGLLFWGYIWGVMGMLLAVPLTSIFKIILEHIEGTKTIAKFMS